MYNKGLYSPFFEFSVSKPTLQKRKLEQKFLGKSVISEQKFLGKSVRLRQKFLGKSVTSEQKFLGKNVKSN